jgi:hypothetical protein
LTRLLGRRDVGEYEPVEEVVTMSSNSDRLSVSRRIPASARRIFAIVADPRGHVRIVVVRAADLLFRGGKTVTAGNAVPSWRCSAARW